MIIKFHEVAIPFDRFAFGTVVEDCKGERYMKVDITLSGSWVPSRPNTRGPLTNAEMRDKIKPDWNVWL